MSTAQDLARRAYWMCTEANIGYSQPNRLDIARTRGVESPGFQAEADCSSLAIEAARQAGIPTGSASYTGDMRAALAAAGWAVIPYPLTGGNADNLYAGDLVLSEAASGGVGHVAVYIGENRLAEAWIDGIGDIGGSAWGDGPGDDTGGETRIVGFYAHPYTQAGRWTHVLRPPTNGANSTAAPTTTETVDMIGDNMYIICTLTPWGEWAYALIHSTIGGARAIDNTFGERTAYEQLLGSAKVVDWDFYNLIVRQAWEQHNYAVGVIRDGVREDIDTAVDRVINATKKEA